MAPNDPLTLSIDREINMLYRQALLASVKLATQGVKRYFKSDREQRPLNAEGGHGSGQGGGSTSTAKVSRACRTKGNVILAGKVAKSYISICWENSCPRCGRKTMGECPTSLAILVFFIMSAWYMSTLLPARGKSDIVLRVLFCGTCS